MSTFHSKQSDCTISTLDWSHVAFPPQIYKSPHPNLYPQITKNPKASMQSFGTCSLHFRFWQYGLSVLLNGANSKEEEEVVLSHSKRNQHRYARYPRAVFLPFPSLPFPNLVKALEAFDLAILMQALLWVLRQKNIHFKKQFRWLNRSIQHPARDPSIY